MTIHTLGYVLLGLGCFFSANAAILWAIHHGKANQESMLVVSYNQLQREEPWRRR